MADRPTVPITDLIRLQADANAPAPLTDEEVHDLAIAAMVVLRGLRRSDKFKVLRRMRRIMG